MPKTKLRHATDLNSQQARLDVASKFISGDSVTHRQTGKVGKFIGINRGFAVIDVWVEFETDSERSVPISCNPLDLELIQQCQQEDTQSSVVSVESQVCVTEESQKLDSNTNSELPNFSKQIPTVELCLPSTTLPSPATTISEHTALHLDNSMLWSEAVPAKELAPPIPVVEDSKIIAPLCGLSNCDSSNNADPISLSGKMLAAPDIQSQGSPSHHSERYLGVLPSAGMMQSGKLLPQPPLERPTAGNGYSLLPTPMAHSRARVEYSRPGQDKLEQKLRELGVIPPGHVSHPAVREYLMGFPDGWTDTDAPDGGTVILLPEQSVPQSVVSQTELQELPHWETPAPPPKLQSHGEELQQSQNPINPDDVTSDSDLESNLAGSSVEHPDNQSCAESIALNLIATDGGTQSRAGLNADTIADYADAMDAGATFPPVLVFYDGENYWLVDGFHRVAAAKHLEWTEIAASVRSGTRRDAVLCSVGVNATHGLRRSNADKRRAVETLLQDEEWKHWPLRKIARTCGVSEGFVHKLQQEASVHGEQIKPSSRVVERNGKAYTQNTTKIGSRCASSINSYQKGGVYKIQAKGNPDLRGVDGEWAVALDVNEYSITISPRSEAKPVLPQFLTEIEPEYWAEIQVISDRIDRLFSCDLDPADDAVLEVLKRRTSFTTRQKTLLDRMEQDYGLT